MTMYSVVRAKFYNKALTIRVMGNAKTNQRGQSRWNENHRRFYRVWLSALLGTFIFIFGGIAMGTNRTPEQLRADNKTVNTAITKGWKTKDIMPESPEGSGYHPSVVKQANTFLKTKKK